MKSRRYYAAIALMLSGLLLLSGCAAGQGSGSNKTTDPRRAYEGTTLNLLLKENYEIEVIQKYHSDFTEKTGININIEVYDESTTRQKFVLDATAKTGFYDVMPISFWYFPEYQKNGWIEPIESYITDKADGEWWHTEDIPESALKIFTVDDKRYALPHTLISGMAHYRKDIFEKHGISPPKTTDDLINAVKKLGELEPDLIGITGRGAPDFSSLGTYLGWAWGYGARLLDENMKPHANSPEMIQALTDYVNLVKDYGPADAPSLSPMGGFEKLMSGNALTLFDTSACGTVLEDASQSPVAGKIGYTILTGPAGRPLQWIYTEALGISADSKNKDAAWLFLQWRMSRETTMKELTDLSRTDTPNLYVLNSDEYKAYAEEHGLAEYTTILPESWAIADIDYWPFIPEYVQIGDTFMVEISNALAGQQDVETALNKAQASIERILSDAGY